MALQPDGGGFDNLTASIRADSRDMHTFLDVLAEKLEGSLPGHVQVEREFALMKKNPAVRRLTLSLDDRRYLLMWSNGSLVAEIDSVAASGVPGFRPFPLEEWVDRLTSDIQRFASSSAVTRSALDNLLEGKAKAVTIARDPDTAASLVALWPQQLLTGASQIQVGAGDQAVVLLDQGWKGPYGPGTTPVWRLALELQGPDDVINDPEQAELQGKVYFVGGVEHHGFRFGGAVDKVEDPETGLAVGLRVFGDYTLQVTDAIKLLSELAPGVPQVTDNLVSDLVRDILLRSFRTQVAAHIEDGWHILGLSAHTDEIEKATLEQAREPLAGYGLVVPRIGSFTVSMKEEDEKLLTEFRARQAANGALHPAPASQQMSCFSCGATNAAGARFCSSCGKPIATGCAACGAANQPGARFCSSCGERLDVAAGKTGA